MTRFFMVAALAAAWFAAFALELLARAMYRSYSAFGSDLPGATLLTFGAVQSYVPWIGAGAATLLVAVLSWRRSAHLGTVCGALALVIALAMSFAVFAIALPQLKMCGGLEFPDWHVAKADANAAGSCGR